jgi:hypothetical protein
MTKSTEIPPKDVECLRAKLLDDLASIEAFAEAINRKPRSVQRMINDGLPTTYVGKTPYIIISKARAFLLSKETPRHEPPRRGRPAGRRAA